MYEPDEPTAKIVAAFQRGPHGITGQNEFAEVDTTEAEFDAMYAAGEPVELVEAPVRRRLSAVVEAEYLRTPTPAAAVRELVRSGQAIPLGACPTCGAALVPLANPDRTVR